jgi:nitrite reductase (NADH) large subunit
METSTAGIFAAGDVAECVDISRKTRWVNAIWPEVVTQGRIAGTNMTGRQVSYKGSLSRNVLRVLNLDVMTMGLVNPPDTSEYEVICADQPRRKTYRKLVFRKNILTEGLEDVVGATFAVEADPQKASRILIGHIEKKCKALGLDSRAA